MFGLGIQELLIILVIVLIFFGAEKIPQLARSLGKGMSEFRKAQQDVKDEIMKEERPIHPGQNPIPSAGSSAKTTTCPFCSKQTSGDSLYCSQCGKAMASDPKRCGVCQRELRDDEKFCPNCGQNRS